MRKRSQNCAVVAIEWNTEDGRIEGLPEEDLLALARALGRLAARRDLARLQRDRAQSRATAKADSPPDDAEHSASEAKDLSVTE
jgi:hypothetical protein